VALTLPHLYPFLAFLPRAMEIASQARIGVDDCLYVALAERERCDLVTADQRLVNTFAGQFPVIPLASL
jgi:predicted nucleic acid-binding protein